MPHRRRPSEPVAAAAKPGMGRLVLVNPAAQHTAFGYDVSTDKKRRRAPGTTLKSEDKQLGASPRRKAINQARNIRRNFAVARWAIAKHLDYTTSFTFQARNANQATSDDHRDRLEALDRHIEELVRVWSRPQNFDLTGRHSLTRFTRIMESCRVTDGDMLIHKLSSGRVSAIEGDRIRTPLGGLPDFLKKADLTHGVHLSTTGRPKGYVVCGRGTHATGFVFEKYLLARHCLHHAYFEGRFDQWRGISPLLSAINDLVDTKEAKVYAVAKMKVSQLFGLVFTRDAAEPIGEPAADDGDEADDTSSYETDLGETGQFTLDLEPGDKAEFLESKQPSTEFLTFWNAVIACALKALDIPYSFYDEAHTNYSGQRQAWIQYDLSANNKRKDVREILDRLIAWRLGLAIVDGTLDLAPYGLTLTDLRWEWIHRGVPWIQPLQEVKADVTALAAGLTSRTRILLRQGLDPREIAEELKREQSIFADTGIALDADAGPSATAGLQALITDAVAEAIADQPPAETEN